MRKNHFLTGRESDLLECVPGQTGGLSFSADTGAWNNAENPDDPCCFQRRFSPKNIPRFLTLCMEETKLWVAVALLFLASLARTLAKSQSSSSEGVPRCAVMANQSSSWEKGELWERAVCLQWVCHTRSLRGVASWFYPRGGPAWLRAR